MDFDLGKLTFVGWLVLIATAAIVMTGIFMVAFSSAAPAVDEVVETRGGRRIVAYVVIGVGVAFFVACKFLLGKIGLPMFRS